MTTLTKQDIADGWIACDGDLPNDIDVYTVIQIFTPSHGTETMRAGDFEPADIDADDDPIGHANNRVTRYRTFSPDLPTTTHVGEAVAWRWRDTTGRWCISDDKVKVGYVLKHVPVDALGVITPTTDGGEAMIDDETYWIALLDPGMVPQRKGPFNYDWCKRFIREVMDHRPTTRIILLSSDGARGVWPEDGACWLQEQDGRSAPKVRRHHQTTKDAHSPTTDKVMVDRGDVESIMAHLLLRRFDESTHASDRDNCREISDRLSLALKGGSE